MALMTAGQLVAQGVVEEKSSRVVELLLATLRPWQLMAGKVLGIGLMGLLQMVLVVGAGVGTGVGPRTWWTPASVDLGSTAVWALVWFVIGFATYALVLAALASLVSRQEDVGGGHRPGHRGDGDPLRRRGQHRPVGPGQPAGGLAVLHPVLPLR